jgi:molybdopterin converting factor small subunit
LLEILDNKSSGMLKKEVLDGEGALDPRFRIYVNGVSCDEKGLDTQISDGDNVMLFSVIDGG